MTQPANPFDFLDDSFDNALDSSRTADNEDLPAGLYNITIKGVSVQTAKMSGNLMLVWDLFVLDGEFEGKPCWKRNMLVIDGVPNTQGLPYLKGDLKMCGIDVESLIPFKEKLPAVLDTLPGINMRIKVKVTTKGEDTYTDIQFKGMIGVEENMGTDDDNIPF